MTEWSEWGPCHRPCLEGSEGKSPTTFLAYPNIISFSYVAIKPSMASESLEMAPSCSEVLDCVTIVVCNTSIHLLRIRFGLRSFF